MKLSTRGEYGLQAMFDLAQHCGEGPISIKTIAERQGISEPYLEQLIAALRKAGLVRSIRGAQGGYILNRDPEDITVGDIIRVLEGPIAPVECLTHEGESCAKADTCVTRDIWEKVRDSISDVLDSFTLADMVAKANKMRQDDKSYMYYI
ncbi:MAG: Rrf2 family transcriptional regulator [Clostridia bacterium]|nr:Rrf2 family transcriptional regulator [Clostridia bacterium]